MRQIDLPEDLGTPYRRRAWLPGQLEKQPEFDSRYPEWRLVVTARRRPYDESAHMAFKYAHREALKAWGEVVTSCPQCGNGRTDQQLVADASSDWSLLRGLVCRPCRSRMSKIHEDYWPHLTEFWLSYCQAYCSTSRPEGALVCERHTKEAVWWGRAAHRHANAVAPSA